jgi:hypothetical protein
MEEKEKHQGETEAKEKEDAREEHMHDEHKKVARREGGEHQGFSGKDALPSSRI